MSQNLQMPNVTIAFIKQHVFMSPVTSILRMDVAILCNLICDN